MDNLLETVFQGRPIGAVLTLEIGDDEPFISRSIEGAPETDEKVTEHLLDGQQRLTALWKSLNELYLNRTYFLRFNASRSSADQIYGRARWMRNGRRYPLWADDPLQLWHRGLVPVRLLRPDVAFEEVDKWCGFLLDRSASADLKAAFKIQQDLKNRIFELQRVVYETNLPFLALPVNTPPDDAIDVFIKMNTSSVRLSTYDIVVAQVEAATGQSLRDLEGGLRSAVPAAERYVDVSDLLLRVATLRQNRIPTVSSFLRLDLSRLTSEWDQIVDGVQGAVRFLEEERVFDGNRLPTVPVVQVLAAIWSQIPQVLDEYGQARNLLRRYLWRSFFTNRYDRATNNAALQDYRGLKSRLVDGQVDSRIPVFDDEQHPLVDVGELLNAGWPRLRNTLARALLAVSLRSGGYDFADGTQANSTSLPNREYHHLFPDSLLRNDGRM